VRSADRRLGGQTSEKIGGDLRTLGAFVLIGAMVGLLVSFAMDVTVGSSIDGSRVVNFGLIAQRNSIQMISGFAALCGVVLIAFGGRRTPDVEDSTDRVPCPACGESVLRVAQICKHCRSELTPTPKLSSTHAPTSKWGLLIVAGIVALLFILMMRGFT